ncbi:hypothetical protein [Mucilaginibacter celer]|uniref:YcxB family protein n=1 Tax=Mucilaginibacter celer TaxID=2305508 RepID=A0A494VSZ0_9SPHI|nr:hypothetical protein [Mucilaginibacter celer]AYL97529.1 hypothetical protein HYN43_020465 [Mucilaginibacter celer]
MNDVIYTIDRNQIHHLVKRLVRNTVKKLSIIAIFVLGTQSLSYHKHVDLIPLILSYVITTIILFGIMLFSVRNRFQKMYYTLRIVLSQEGVEIKGEGIPYKSIRWENLLVKVQKNNVIDLWDDQIANWSRKWSGKGWIRIQPEIENREDLINELMKRGRAVI